MSKLSIVESLLNKLNIKLNKAGETCEFNSNGISLSREQIKSFAWDTKVSEAEVTLYCLLHELGHALQPISLNYLYKFNPLPAEEDAWYRAEDIYRKLWGSIPQSFYKVKAYCLNSYYNANPNLINWG